jgi:hypothetical protein
LFVDTQKANGSVLYLESRLERGGRLDKGVAPTQFTRKFNTRSGIQNISIYSCRPWVAGISGGPDGAYSVALSGGYDDDVDEGYAFTYT